MEPMHISAFPDLVDNIQRNYQPACCVGTKKIPVKYLYPSVDMRTGYVFSVKIRPWFGKPINLDFRDDEPMPKNIIPHRGDCGYDLYDYINDVLNGKFENVWIEKKVDE